MLLKPAGTLEQQREVGGGGGGGGVHGHSGGKFDENLCSLMASCIFELNFICFFFCKEAVNYHCV